VAVAREQFHPIADGDIFGLAHAPNVADVHVVFEDDGAGSGVGHAHFAGRRNLEGLVVRSVLFGLLRHEPDVGVVAHRGPVELAVLPAVFQNDAVCAGVATIRNHAFDVFQFVVFVPHLASVADDIGHGGVDDHVGGNVQVGDAVVRVHHRQTRPGRVSGG